MLMGSHRCPKCGGDGVPCDPSEDVRVVLNWHELLHIGDVGNESRKRYAEPKRAISQSCHSNLQAT